jgi:hypothetical protein
MRDALSTTMRRDLPEWRRRFKLRDKDVEMLRNTLRKFRIKHLPLTDAASHTWNRVQELIGASNERTELSWTYPCGTSPSHTPSFDHQAPYIHFWLRLIGVHEVHSVIVDNAWNQDHAQSEASLAAGKQSVERIVEGFWGLSEPIETGTGARQWPASGIAPLLSPSRPCLSIVGVVDCWRLTRL